MHLKYTALFTSVNLLLGVGPLILPMPYFNAGLGLSTIWMLFITLLSYNSAMFISESMSKLHQIQYNRQNLGESVTDHALGQSLITQEQANQENQKYKQSFQSKQQIVENNDQEQQRAQKTKQYDHSLQFQILYGSKWKYFPSIAITIYLGGTSISKCIMTGNILSKVFADVNAPDILGQFNFWLFIFFLCGAFFSFKSIEKTKVMQTIIIGVRCISIILFLFGAIFLISRDGMKTLTPPGKGYFNFDSFIQIFSNSVFAYMFHHSLPSIAGSLKTTEDVTFVLRWGFLISGAILILLPLTGSMAFGSDLGTGDKLIYYNFDFEHQISVVYWVTSFYVFLNIAAFSVYIIVIRTYVLHMIDPEINARIFSKKTLISSLAILICILLASWLLKNYIQIVLDFTGGIFGIIILFIIPCMEVKRARKLIHQPGQIRNYIRYLPQAIMILGILFMGFNLYNIIRKL